MKLTFKSAAFCAFVGAFVFATPFLSGCKKNVNGTVPVTVSVYYNGSPVEEAVVVFQGSAPDAVPASAATDKNGSCRLSSFEPNDGARPGDYLVGITKAELVEERDPDDPSGDRILKSETVFHIPANYGNPRTSGLTATVVDGQKNEFRFDLDDSGNGEVDDSEGFGLGS